MQQPITIDSLLPFLSPTGRASRREWWLVHVLCAVVFAWVEEALIPTLWPGRHSVGFNGPFLLWLVLTATLFWISFASMARRLHDRGKSGWWSLLYLVPGIGWLWLIFECGFLPGVQRVIAAPAVAASPKPALASKLQRTAKRSVPPIAPRVGTVQRMERSPWTRDRVLKLAAKAVVLALAALFFYKWILDGAPLPAFDARADRQPPRPAAAHRRRGCASFGSRNAGGRSLASAPGS